MGDIVEDMAKPNVDKIGLNDDRVQSCFATVSGQKWRKLYSSLLSTHMPALHKQLHTIKTARSH